MRYTISDTMSDDVFTNLELGDLQAFVNDMFWENEEEDAFNLPEQKVIDTIEVCGYIVEREEN